MTTDMKYFYGWLKRFVRLHQLSIRNRGCGEVLGNRSFGVFLDFVRKVLYNFENVFV